MKKKKGTLRLPALLAALCALALGGGWLMDSSGLATLGFGSGEAVSALRFSEVQNHNALTLVDDDGQASGWIEIENTGDAPYPLRGVCITRDSKLNKTFVFPDVTLAPGELILVYASGSGNGLRNGHCHAPFKLRKSGGSTLFLYDERQVLLDSVEVPAMQVDESLCRDEEGNWTVTARATPGKPNEIVEEHALDVREGDVAISEVMTRNVALFPDEDGDYPDYVELYNRSGHAVNLKGYCLSDRDTRIGKWRLPEVTLPAGGYLAIHCSGKDRKGDPRHLHTNFRLSEDETLVLAQGDGAVISAVTLPELDAGQALSWKGGWTDALPPTPGLPNTFDSAVRLDAEGMAARSKGVYLSELMAGSEEDDSDWLELHNGGGADVDLSGCGLSDRVGHPRKWQFPAGTVIPAGGYMKVSLSPGGKGPLNADFALPMSGGCTVSLCAADGALLDTLFLPAQYGGVSYGRGNDGALGYMSRPTPGAANDAALKDRPGGAEYSAEGGLYHSGDVLSVTLSAQAGDRIYYTLDCTDPDETKTLYGGEAIPVTKDTVLRTRVYREGCLPSFMDTQSYLFDVPCAADAPYVVSLVSDPDNLYSDERGIMAMGPHATKKFPHGDYGKGANFWMDWEREAHVEVFTGGGATAISQECGIKLHGRNTRAYELKCFKVMAKSRYGDTRFRYPLFHERPYNEYEAFILRYSGQDYKYAFMRDTVMTDQARHTRLVYMESEECICYLNGEYYSTMYLRENVSPFSICRREGWTGQERDIDLVKSGLTVKQGSNESYVALKQFLQTHDNQSQEVYDRIAAEVDIDNFIDYLTLQVVYCPPDTVNVKRYRNTRADGLWRWVVYDFDRGLRGGDDATDGFALMTQGTNADLFKAFMANPPLRERFIARLDEALGSFLSTQALLEAVDAQYQRIVPLLPPYWEKMGLTRKKYDSAVNSLRTSIRKRPAQVLRHCAEYLSMTEDQIRQSFPRAISAIEAAAQPNT